MFVLLKIRKKPSVKLNSVKYISHNAIKNELLNQIDKMPEGLKQFTQGKLMLKSNDEPTQEIHNYFVQANKNPDNLKIAERIEVLEFLVTSKFSTKENIISNYKTILELEPDNTEYMQMYADYLMDVEMYEESLIIWKKVLVLEPKNLIASIRLADCYTHVEVYEEALEIISKALLVQNLNPQLHEKKATLLFKLGKTVRKSKV